MGKRARPEEVVQTTSEVKRSLQATSFPATNIEVSNIVAAADTVNPDTALETFINGAPRELLEKAVESLRKATVARSKASSFAQLLPMYNQMDAEIEQLQHAKEQLRQSMLYTSRWKTCRNCHINFQKSMPLIFGT